MDKGTKYLNKIVNVEIDRPLGSLHPTHNFEYKVNYGFIPNTVSGDGEELDAYVIGVNEPLKTFSGRVIAVVERLEEDDDKLVVVKDGDNYTNEEIEKLVEFQEKWKKHRIVR